MSVPIVPVVGVGDLVLLDNRIPQLYGDDYTITASHDAGEVLAQPASAVQRFTVVAPQVTLPPTELVQLYPPDGSTGQYADVLPFVVLATPELPWERKMPDPADPWLAVLVLTDDEIIGGTSTTRTTTVSVEQYRQLPGVLVPPIEQESDVADDQPCAYVVLPTTVFAAVAPRLTECRYFSHVRAVNTGDQDLQGLSQNGVFSVVVANRFPSVGAAGTAVRSIAHLVSLEALSPYLVENPVFTHSGTDDGTTVFDNIALLSVASWTFQTVADPAEDFRGLATDLITSEYDTATGTHHPDNLLLRLPVPALDTGVDVNAEIVARVGDGYVPLEYHARSGESTLCWYRGPITPVLPAGLVKPGPFLSADAAMAYSTTYGVFDLALAAAWQIGRLTALADRSFAQALFDYRRRIHLVTDELADRLDRDDFDDPSDIAELAQSGLLAQRLAKVLDAELLADLGLGPRPQPVPPGNPQPDSTPQQALQNFLDDPTNQAAVLGLVVSDLDPVATWLAGLVLLEPLPFEQLVPDPAMLPQGAVRFGYLDPNWVGALLDGATSIGLESSRQTFCHTMTADVIADAAIAAAAVRRQVQLGIEPGPTQSPGVIGAMLLRSSLVSGWPDLAVRPLDSTGTLLKTLRMDHLSSGVLLCLFDGVPSSVVIAEPQQGFRFGLDDDGAVQTRNIDDGADKLGAPIGQPFPVRSNPAFLRADGRVLDLAPGATTGLLGGLQTTLAALGQQVGTLGPASFALQMIKTPESLTFTSGVA